MGHTDLLGKAATTSATAGQQDGRRQAGLRRAQGDGGRRPASRACACCRRMRGNGSRTWFKRRPRVRIAKRQGRVAVFPTCLVEYQQPAIGHDLVKVYERNGIECSLADDAGCCGAPWLHSGDVEQFTKVAEQEREGARQVDPPRQRHRRPQPTCGYVLKKDYVDYVGGADAQLVADHTYDAAEYLMKVHKADGTTLDTDFTRRCAGDGHVPHAVPPPGAEHRAEEP